MFMQDMSGILISRPVTLSRLWPGIRLVTDTHLYRLSSKQMIPFIYYFLKSL